MKNATIMAAIATWRGQDNPAVQHKFVVADDAKQAEMKSELLADPARDFDYVTMFTRPICKVNVKGKPLGVASVENKRQK